MNAYPPGRSLSGTGPAFALGCLVGGALTLLLVLVVVLIPFALRASGGEIRDVTTDVIPAATATIAETAQATCDLQTHECTKAPIMTIEVNKQYTATIVTARGNIVITLDAKHAPYAVNNFIFLARVHWYDGTYFWRVEWPGKPSSLDPSGAPSQLSLIQGGSVADNGQDGPGVPGYTIQDDPVIGDYSPGTVAMATSSQPNSASTQFFIDVGDESKFFTKTYPIFGQVTSGMDVVRSIEPKDKIETITIAER